MAFGTALGIITIASIVGGTIIDAVAAKKAGTAAKELAEFNAEIAERQAADALILGREEENRFRAGVRGLIGRQKAGFAGQNIDLGVGTPVDVVADSAFIGELDVITIKTNAARAAWGYTVQAENFRRGGNAATTSANFSVASSILGGATSLLALRLGMGGGAGTSFVPGQTGIESFPPGGIPANIIA